MANASYATNGLAGARFLVTTTTALFALGQIAKGNNGSEWIYVQANTAVTGPGYVCVVDTQTTAFGADMITTSNASKGMRVAVPGVAFAALDYGWMQTDGYCAAVRANTSAGANVQMNTTATAGQLDVDGSTGTKKIDTIVLTTAIGGAPGVQPGDINKAIVGSTN